MGQPHGIIKIRRSSNLGVEEDFDVSTEEGVVVAEGKFLYGRPFLEGKAERDWRSNSSVLQTSLQILNRKISL